MQNTFEGIFGTPPEPQFNVKPCLMNQEGLDDWLAVLKEQNRLKKKNVKTGFYKNGPPTEFLFLICDMLGLSDSAKYLALEIFDRFMILHMYELYDHVQKKSCKSKVKEWGHVVQRVREQAYLRAVSCIQIASKLTSHYKIVSLRRAWTILNGFGQRYNTKSIAASEVRILKLVDFNVQITYPLIHIESLLEILGRCTPTLDVRLYHNVCVKYLDLAFLQRRSIYNMLYTLATGKPVTSSKDSCRMEFSIVEQDNLLLASAVIAATAYIVDQSTHDKVVTTLTKKTQVPKGDILDFATVLVQMSVMDTDL